jgi:hypothetical protein
MAETSAGVQASGRTSQTCREAGPYRSSRNAQVTVFLKPGDRFPADTDGAETTWTMGTDANEATPEEI